MTDDEMKPIIEKMTSALTFIIAVADEVEAEHGSEILESAGWALIRVQGEEPVHGLCRAVGSWIVNRRIGDRWTVSAGGVSAKQNDNEVEK